MLTSKDSPKDMRVPLIEQPFLLDQRGHRIGRIGNVDIPETNRLAKMKARKVRANDKLTNHLDEVPLSSRLAAQNRPLGVAVNDTEEDTYLPRAKQTSETSQNTMKLENTALVAQRFGVSHTATAAIVSSAFLDAKKAGLITGSSARLVKEGTKYHRRVIKEEHISLVGEPGSKYVGHVTPRSGTAEAECHAILEYLESKSIDISHLKVAGADGTSVNTGRKGGVIRKLEENIKMPLQWVICLLHFNELPFRALFEHVDSVSASPNLYTGPIGSKLPDCEKLPVAKFVSFPKCKLPDDVINVLDLSTDQFHNSIKDGSRHLFDTIRRTRYLPANPRKVVDASIQQNSYFAFPENILLSMMTDEEPGVRKLSLDRILEAKEAEQESGDIGKTVRYNTVPTVNFKADTYQNMIDWTNITVTVPPVIRDISNAELIARLTNNTVVEWEFAKFPCHTVAVERTVKLVTEAASLVCGPESRDGHIRATLKSREQLKKFDTKSDFLKSFQINSK
ncbi:hypothetical protein FOCC_FOCC012463 [Frankliniella occidentalis]|nr:hypothetical protein FOCC_FOCC012463 [Frankliniella occidentalis]